MKNILSTVVLTFFLISCRESTPQQERLNLESKLAGKWIAKAFDGELHEEWVLGKDGWMQQTGYYIEDADTSYSAKTKIERVGDEVILFSVIKDSNPKIFKATALDEDEIVFENGDYRNPFEVKYEFFSEGNYRRTIRGYEPDSSLVVYEFNFEKVH